MWSPDTVSAAIRGMAFILLFQAAGAAIFSALVARRLARSDELLRQIRLTAALGGAMLVGVHLVLEAARLTGTFAGALNPDMQRLVLTSAGAASHALQMTGLIVLAISARKRSGDGCAVAMTGVGLVLAAFLLTGHTQTHALRPLLALLLFIHILIVAGWFGSLLPLSVVVQRESSRVAADVLERFSRLAVWLVPALAVAGGVLLGAIARGLPQFDEPYGVLMLIKITAYAVLLGLASLNKLRLVPALAAGNPTAGRRLQRSIFFEAAIMIGVLVCTAVLTSFYSP